MEARAYTYHTRLDVNDANASFLNDFGRLYGRVERNLHSEYAAGKSILNCKSDYIKRFGITARQFNSVRIMLQGKHRSILALQADYIADTKVRLKKTEKRIKVLSKKAHRTQKEGLALFQKRRLAERQKLKIANLESDKAQSKVRICFGSKALFKQQHDLQAYGFENHEQWLDAWQTKRSNQFYLVGSKDETSGNQSVVATLNETGSIDLRIRVPDSLIAQHGKFVTIKDVTFPHGDDHIKQTLLDNYKRQSLKKTANIKQHGNLYQQHGSAMNYRFMRDEKGWRVFITADYKFKQISDKSLGAIGVDINADHLAVCEIDETGNYIKSFNIRCCTYGKNQNQAKAIIGDACKAIVAFAELKQKPIILEKLDFGKKKQSLSSMSNAKARMLSGFAYNQIKQNLQSRAFKHGVEVLAVNPAYSSVIGQVKFAHLYNISVHQSAAFVIARRYYGYSERLPKRLENIPMQGYHTALPGLVKSPAGHSWKAWAIIQRQLKTVHAAHFQMLAQSPVGMTRQSSFHDNEPLPF
jgi:IS605 OrfB family transposase